MPISFLGDGLVFEETIPVSWTSAPLAEGATLLRLNADNQQLLVAESSLEEVRVHEALKDESPALIHELQRIEYKINILLRLTAELTLRGSGLPAPQKVRIASHAMEWLANPAPAVGSTGVVSIYINPALPQPLKFAASIEGEGKIDGAKAVQVRFVGVGDAVATLLEKLVFRHHRRLVAGAKGSSVDIETTLRPTRIK